MLLLTPPRLASLLVSQSGDGEWSDTTGGGTGANRGEGWRNLVRFARRFRLVGALRIPQITLLGRSLLPSDRADVVGGITIHSR